MSALLAALAVGLMLASCVSDEKSGNGGASVDTLPLPPSFIRAVPEGASIRVLWAPPEQPPGAEAFVWEARTFPDTTHSCQGNSSYECVIGGLVQGTTYYFRVRSQRNAPPHNWGPWSHLDSVFLPPPPPPVAPSAPGSPAADYSDSAEGAFRVTWTASESDGGAPVIYRAYAVEDSAKQCLATQTGCTVANLEPGRAYSFRVVAFNSAGSSAPSQATPPLMLHIVVPLNFTARASGKTANLRDVVWTGSLAVVVGDGGTILTSPDGIAWTARASGVSQDLHGVAWSGSLLMAVGDGGVALSSSDGTSWTSVSTGTSANLREVAWAGGLFVTTGAGGIFTSAGGAWTRNATAADGAQSRVLASSTGRVMIAGAKEQFLRSTNPAGVWEEAYYPGAYAGGIEISDMASDSLFAVTGSQSYLTCVTAGTMHCYNWVVKQQPYFGIFHEGSGWQTRAYPGNVVALEWIGPQLIAVLDDGTVRRSYTRGATWTEPVGSLAAVRALARCGAVLVGVGIQGAVFTAPLNP